MLNRNQIEQMIQSFCEESSNTKANILCDLIRVELLKQGIEFISNPLETVEGHYRTFKISIHSDNYTQYFIDNLHPNFYNIKNFPLSMRVMHHADYIDVITSCGTKYILKNRN